MRSRTSAFTLIEIAIVLLIIGVLLGLIIKGQELVNNAKAKKLHSRLMELQIALLRYYDMYGRWPGDCNRNGIIEAWVNHDVPTEKDYHSNPSYFDSCLDSQTEADFDKVFGDLRRANLLPPNVSNRDSARHPFGHFFAVGFAGMDWTRNIHRPNIIVVYNIPVWTARMIDVMIDGSINSTAGRVRKTEINAPDYSDMSISEDLKTHIAFYFDRLP